MPLEPAARATIITGDAVRTLASIDDATCALTLFSPPYDKVRDYEDHPTYDSRTLGDELLRVTMDGGICAVVIGDGTEKFAKSLTSFRLAVDWCDRVGWRLFECCIYQRDGRPGAWWSKRFRVDHEYLLFFLKGARPRYFDKTHLTIPTKHAGAVWHGTQRHTDGTLTKIGPKAVSATKCRGTIWPYATSNSEGNKEKMRHPATFPDKLADDVIRCFSRPGDLVLDPMCGSGTTLAMALRAGRSAIGIEIAEDYATLARERIAREQGGSVLDNTLVA